MLQRKITQAIVGATALATGVLAGFPPLCPWDSPLSCHNTTAVKDSCCFSYPGGQLLQVQLWDTNPSTGPNDHWTIHGLWPDNCDGSYQSSCDPARAYTNITQILESYGRYDLLWYMNHYWINGAGTGVSSEGNEEFWAHEWGKHGTCMNTLDPNCYHNYRPQEEVVDFFQRVVLQFAELPTYRWLAAAGITPSATRNYTYDQVQAALSRPRGGVNATLECSAGQLYSVYYTFEVRGSVATGRLEPAQPIGEGVGCPPSFQYLPKNGTSGSFKW